MSEHFNKALNRWQITRDDGTRTYRYRAVMEEHLGRPLTSDEHVHHINGDTTDDRIENLQIVTASEHGRIHAGEGIAALKAKWQYEWSSQHPACVECGTTERKHGGRGLCERCYWRIRNWTVKGHSPRKPATVLHLVCPWCDTAFERTLKQGRNTYCSKSCSSRAAAARRAVRAAAA